MKSALRCNRFRQLVDRIELRTEYRDREQLNLLGGENVTPYLRRPEMSKAASDVSPHTRAYAIKARRDAA